ncbi:aspartate/glutamate racemase family protein [Halococcus sp. PRR34]|uniref:aspartate/glutamate racemase family protein n=1 Tax=Halococcus sp. PRR34 TaxID=3020830 RepID=UPI0023611204|nr:aspartate/glutamate racemase family protein [Halococcus sp. PRR34]
MVADVANPSDEASADGARILVVNPNTSTEMTERIAETADRAAGPQTEIITDCPDRGPESLESFYEYHLATGGLLETVAEYQGDVDGVVVGCFGDPGLYPLKEVLNVPVVGVAEASMGIATVLGHRFSILVALKRAVPMMENLVRQYGLNQRLATVEATGLSVLDLERDPEQTLVELTAAGERATDSGAEVFVLGCSGMSGYEEELANRLGAPVIDPIANAVVTAEMVHRQGLTQNKTGLWGTPPTKEIRGDLLGDSFASE